MLDGHCGIDDWEIILIDKGRSNQEITKKELFWQYKLEGHNNQETTKKSFFGNISLTDHCRSI